MAHKHLLRTRFKTDIVAEFLPPVGRDRGRVAVFLPGMPGLPGLKREVVDQFATLGYWVFVPRYRGSWESGGEFLRHEPTQDVLDLVETLPKGFKSAWDGQHFQVEPSELVIVGTSFGGPAALLASRDPRVTAVIALSAVVDWTQESRVESLAWLYEFTREAFGQGYRVSKRHWRKLKTGSFYNPVSNLDRIDPAKCWLIHAEDDEVVPIGPVRAFAQKAGIRLKSYKRGGHFGSSILLKPSLKRQVSRFVEKCARL